MRNDAAKQTLLPILCVLGPLVIIFSMTMGIPLALSLFKHDGAHMGFAAAISVSLLSGLLMTFISRKSRRELIPKDGFLLVTLTWFILPLAAAIPLWMEIPDLSFVHAYFETVSGLTTTGASVLTGLDSLPLSINIWRCLLMWMGGMGILVLAVAILPLLGVGGAQVIRAETSGPMKDAKLTPRIADTAKILYTIYLGLSAACFMAYRFAGMSWADAFMHMCATVSLGGFSSHDESFGFWNSPLINAITTFFLLLSGFNFSLHFYAWNKRSLKSYFTDVEARAWIFTFFAVPAGISLMLWAYKVYPDLLTALRYGFFNTACILSTTGFTDGNIGAWPSAAVMVIYLCSCFATCGGSVGGGIKMIRGLIACRQASREFICILHPSALYPLRIGSTMVPNHVVFSIVAFLLMYGLIGMGCMFLLMISGMDPLSAFTCTLACLNNVGVAISDPAHSYLVFSTLTTFQTWLFLVVMVIGRLEIFTVLVLFTRAFWRA